jgi:hypothetical protein
MFACSGRPLHIRHHWFVESSFHGAKTSSVLNLTGGYESHLCCGLRRKLQATVIRYMISLLLLCGSLDDHQDLRSPYATSANRNVSAHIARTGDAVGDEGRQNDVTSTGEPIAKGGMNMHVPKARNQESAGCIDHPRVLRYLNSSEPVTEVT